MSKYPMDIHHGIPFRITDDNSGAQFYVRKMVAKTVDDLDSLIESEIVKILSEDGITDLLVIDRGFILSAIREKMEREGTVPAHGREYEHHT